MRFIGPYARIKVMQITQKYRRSIGECEECKSDAKLEAAHVKGKERPKIISDILNNFIEDSSLKLIFVNLKIYLLKLTAQLKKLLKYYVSIVIANMINRKIFRLYSRRAG